MASVKELRLRITSVGNIQQITRAMEMVATTKLRRFQDRAIASRPYTEEIAGLVSHLAGVLGEDIESNPLFSSNLFRHAKYLQWLQTPDPVARFELRHNRPGKALMVEMTESTVSS